MTKPLDLYAVKNQLDSNSKQSVIKTVCVPELCLPPLHHHHQVDGMTHYAFRRQHPQTLPPPSPSISSVCACARMFKRCPG